MQTIVEIPDTLAELLRCSPAEAGEAVLLELVLSLYIQGRVSLGKAADWLQISRWDFEEILAERKVTRPVSIEDIDQDLATAAEILGESD